MNAKSEASTLLEKDKVDRRNRERDVKGQERDRRTEKGRKRHANKEGQEPT